MSSCHIVYNVVQLLGYALLMAFARGMGFDFRSRRHDFRDWLSPASKSRYGWNTAKATQDPQYNQPSLWHSCNTGRNTKFFMLWVSNPLGAERSCLLEWWSGIHVPMTRRRTLFWPLRWYPTVHLFSHDRRLRPSVITKQCVCSLNVTFDGLFAKHCYNSFHFFPIHWIDELLETRITTFIYHFCRAWK